MLQRLYQGKTFKIIDSYRMKRKGAKTVRSCFHSLLKFSYKRHRSIHSRIAKKSVSWIRFAKGINPQVARRYFRVHPKNRAAFLTDKSLL